jgi:hypothetical protein
VGDYKQHVLEGKNTFFFFVIKYFFLEKLKIIADPNLYFIKKMWVLDYIGLAPN